MSANDQPLNKISLGELLEAWRTGWGRPRGANYWMRLSPTLDRQAIHIEFKELGMPHLKKDPSHVHIEWWDSEKTRNYEPITGLPAEQLAATFALLGPMRGYRRCTIDTDGHVLDGPFTELLTQEMVLPRSALRLDGGVTAHVKPKPVRRMALRFQVLHRDGFRCRYCGATADQARLQVDHVMPRSKGGATTLENLVTACWECNIGKRDTILNDPAGADDTLEEASPPASNAAWTPTGKPLRRVSAATS